MTKNTAGCFFVALVISVGAFFIGCSDEENADENAPSAENGILPEKVEGVWVFSHTPEGWNAAAGSGIAQIVGDCLVVGDMVVVWHSNQLDLARNLVAKVKSGEQPLVEIGGSGVSLDDTEGDRDVSLPSNILDRCPTTRTVWYGGDF